jgi:hypothetical protein
MAQGNKGEQHPAACRCNITVRVTLSAICSWCKGCFSEAAERRKAEGPPVKVSERDCSICKQRKPASAFMKDSRRITGLDARCRECRRAQHAARKQRNLATGAAPWPEKECKRCHVVKPADEFKRHAYTTSGLVSDVHVMPHVFDLRMVGFNSLVITPAWLPILVEWLAVGVTFVR